VTKRADRSWDVPVYCNDCQVNSKLLVMDGRIYGLIYIWLHVNYHATVPGAFWFWGRTIHKTSIWRSTWVLARNMGPDWSGWRIRCRVVQWHETTGFSFGCKARADRARQSRVPSGELHPARTAAPTFRKARVCACRLAESFRVRNLTSDVPARSKRTCGQLQTWPAGTDFVQDPPLQFFFSQSPVCQHLFRTEVGLSFPCRQVV
jgi:hypothetical protein